MDLEDSKDNISKKEPKKELVELAGKINELKKRLLIPEKIAKDIKEQLDDTYDQAEENIALVGGSPDDIAKMWGYNIGGLLYEYLSKRDSLEGRQALSFIRMNLGYELIAKGMTEIEISSFIMGLSLRYNLGFENMKKKIAEIERMLGKIECE
ncbi:MAG: hypothetical protein EAX86_11260 [Candidatus Heimdallarchaeota archaeon]|nr:hypothetical protein [Candidatus Heimdallarchaeota archaeon]